MNSNSITFILVFITSAIFGQNLSDIARWSYLDPAGTARTLGVGSAFGAMGGDYSVIHINPAGIADFRISEFTVTPSLKSSKSTAFFMEDPSSSNSVNKTAIGLDNIAFVFASNPKSSWTSSNFALGFSRQADLSRRYEVAGYIPGSISTYFAEKANRIKPADLDDFIAFPAYSTGAIYDSDNDNFYETDFPSASTLVNRRQNVTQSGGVNELTLGWAGEYEHKLNLGFALGVPFYSFTETKIYEETDNEQLIPVFDRLTYNENLSTTGVGINLKGGFTYKIAQKVRIAGAFHSPTWARFSDDYSTFMQYSFNDGNSNTFDYQSSDGSFEYKMTTPWKFIGSLGTTYKIGDIVGFVDGDIEFIDYTNANYNGTAFSSSATEQTYTNAVNRDIQQKFGAATNFRIGTELGYKNLRIRGGYGIERTPFIADDFYNKKYSFGIGYRENKFFLDLGVRINHNSEGYNPYTLTDSTLDPLALVAVNRVRGAITLGFKF